MQQLVGQRARALGVLGQPALRSELAEPLEVRNVGVRHDLSLKDTQNNRCQYATDRMDRVVAREALAHQALESRCDRRFVAQENLVLDRDVGERVKLRIRQADARSAMVVLHQGDSLALGAGRPQSLILSAVRIVL